MIILIVAILTIPNTALAQGGAHDIRLDLVNCQPEGFRGTLQAGYDPADFWSQQVIALERFIEDYNIERPDADCSERADGPIELEECQGYTRNHVDSVRRCLLFAKRMMNLYRR
jgi:hypothetical protein